MIRDTFISLLAQINTGDREEELWNTKIFVGNLLKRLDSEDQADVVQWLLKLRREQLLS